MSACRWTCSTFPPSEEVYPTSIPSTRVVPDDQALARIAALLASAHKPMIYIGDGIAESEANEELTQVAELLGAEVWAADTGEVNMAFGHPLFQGMTGHMFGYESLPITRRGDVNLVCGTYMLPEVFPELGNIFAPGPKTIHIDLNAYEIAKNHAVDIGLVSDPKLTLGLLAERLKATMTPDQAQAARARTGEIGRAKRAGDDAAREKDRAAREAIPLAFSRFAEELARQLPGDAIIFDEALTNSPAGHPVHRREPSAQLLPDPGRLPRCGASRGHRGQAGQSRKDGRSASAATAPPCTRSRPSGRRSGTTSTSSS